MLNLNCVICADLFSPSDDVHVTTCGHMFHFSCLKQWLERSKSCPQCRNKCTDRNIFRVYFNLANLDVSRIDVGSLQEQLDNVNLKVKIKEKDLNKAEEQVKSLKDTQKKCMKTIAGLEQKLQKNDFIIMSYTEQMKLLKTDARVVDDLRKEVKSLKHQIETMEGVSSILTASNADAEKLLKNESDPKKLSVWVTTLKRELRICENKKTDLRNVLRVVQNDLRKEIELKKIHEERISQLESEHYQLNEKINALQMQKSSSNANSSIISLDNSLLAPLKREHKRLTVSPSIKDNIKKIEESSSPYLLIKSSSVGLAPLFKRHHEPQTTHNDGKTTTTKMATLKISPSKSAAGIVRKTASDLSEKYSIFKKPRLGLAAAAASAGSASLLKPLGPNFVFNGFGGTEKVDPFASRHSDEEDEEYYDAVQATTKQNQQQDETENERRARKLATITNNGKAPSIASVLPPKNTLSLSNRLKAGGLRNFKVNK